MLVHAAEHGGRDLYAGGAARMLALQQRMSPRALDALLATRLGRRGMMTRHEKSADAPDNLFEPLPGHATAADGFRSRKHSASNWLARRAGGLVP
jgi:hypothetical protein